MKKIVKTGKAPRPGGAYSQGVVAGGLVFVSGQGATDPATNSWVGGDIRSQTRMALENVRGILEAAGSSMGNVTKVTVFLRGRELFKEMNEAYSEFFPQDPPARSTVVTDLVKEGMLIEIDAVATVG